jgi:hypothetical protein
MDQMNMSEQTLAAPLEKKLMKDLEFVSRVRQVFPPNARMQCMHTFLLVVCHPGRSVEELAKLAGVGQTVMSRHLREIGPTMRHQEPGFGWIDIALDPKDMRRHTYVLTSKGEFLARELAATLE